MHLKRGSGFESILNEKFKYLARRTLNGGFDCQEIGDGHGPALCLVAVSTTISVLGTPGSSSTETNAN
jgi:hypothetical protein